MAEFENASTMNVMFPLNLNAAGNIAASDETVASTSTFSINNIKKNATVAEAKTVFDAIVKNIGGGTYTTSGGYRIIKERVVD